MSHFSRIRTQMVDKDLVLKAITDLGFKYEVNEGLQVKNFGHQTQAVDIKIKLPMARDIGLSKRGEHYEIVGDFFGIRGITAQELTQQLNQRYAYHAAKDKLEAQGFNLVEEKVEETGQIRLVLRRMA